MRQPSVSICIPTYNGARYLEECLESAIGQTHRNLEVLAVDDGSSDDTVSILQRYAQRDRRVRLVQNPSRLGLVGNWNRCVEIASGDWLKFLFQDDVLHPTCVERMLAASQTSDQLMVVCRRNIVFDDVSETTRKFYALYQTEESLEAVFASEVRVSPRSFSNAVLEHIRHNFIGEPTSVLLHRSAFERFGRFNPDLISKCDLEFWIRVGVSAGLVQVPEALATFRVHSRSASADIKRTQEYRLRVLDSLIMLHEFAFHAAFAPLRAAAAERQPPINLRRMFARSAVNARRNALKWDREFGVQDPLDEWREVADRYPRVKWSWPVFTLQLGRMPRRIAKLLDRRSSFSSR
jgi:glycosyltransferase involved in cell wall biosynthesis